MLLYHTGFQEIRTPDVRHGRKNTDFGQGFYLTADREFACRWARERKGMETVVNVYELDPEGLKILHLSRDSQWFDYIYANRSGRTDTIDADVITGPIANDTLYDTFGIITSGFLKNEDALRLLLIGPEYHQIALKTEKAASRLKWLSARVLTTEEIAGYRLTVAEEERKYQEQFAAEMTRISG